MKYIANFIRKSLFYHFCLPELISICEMYKVELKYDKNYSGDVFNDPIIEIDIPNIETSDIAQKICERAILTRNIVKVYSEGSTIEELIENVDRESFLLESESEDTMKFEIDAKGKVLSQKEKIEIIDKFNALNFKGKVNLTNPKRLFIVIDNHHRGKKYFGKILAGGYSDDALFYSKYNLEGRKYLGPTSTDNVLAFLMCNLAQVTPYSLVLDPFVGTGSLLIPPAHFGAIVTGCDIDMRVIKGYSVGYSKEKAIEKNKQKKGQGKFELNTNEKPKDDEKFDIFTNFIHYQLPLPNVLRADINYLCFRKGECFDMIICDPPYGHRAFTRKTGITEAKRAKREARLAKKYENFSKKGETDEKISNKDSIIGDKIETAGEDFEYLSEKVEEIEINTNQEESSEKNKDKKDHPLYFSPMNQCSVETIFENLLNLGNQCLKVGGLLVCLYPTSKNKDEEGNVIETAVNYPKNPNFEMIFAIENAYSIVKSRWCLVYRKIK